ncbi:hypothetical protein [Shewanella marisflavi]|uniref:hypothetical protein n=1 Tax=Shewanella marisflavi TaxID=260364 RepID=UPI003AADF258
MAINQSHIIKQIPQLVKDEYFHQLMTLRSLASIGWGFNSKLYLLIDGIIDMHNDCEKGEYVIFDAKNRTYQKATRYENGLLKTAYKNEQGEIVLEFNNRG